MKTGFTWLFAIGSSAMLTLAGFTGFSKLVKNDISSQITAPQVERSTISFHSKPIEPMYELYQIKTFAKFTPVIGPEIAPIVTCGFGVWDVPEQAVVHVTKPDFEISLDFGLTIHEPSTCADETALRERYVPNMPAHATKSGHCRLAFQLGKDGYPFNVKAIFCTENMFAEPSIHAVQKWRHTACSRASDFDTALIRETSITYLLTDENGNVLPE